MLKANELRIGNKFQSFVGVQTVKDIMDNTNNGKIKFESDFHRQAYSHLITCTENNNQYKPIEIEPLVMTEEWALKYGFTNVEKQKGFNADYYRHKSMKMTLALYKSMSGDDFYFESFRDFMDLGDCHVGSVHRLQNMFFWFTGEELEMENDLIK